MKRVATPARPRYACPDDSGFTVTEVIVAIVLVTIVMTSLAAFFVTSGNVTDYQGQRQTAVQVAGDAMDKALDLSNAAMLAGRDQKSSTDLWTAGLHSTSFPGVAAYLSGLGEAWDDTIPVPANDAGYTAALPTNGNEISLDGQTFHQNWFLGYCLRAAAGGCTAGPDSLSPTSYLQIVVAVTWNNRACANQVCSYITADQVSQTADPVFDPTRGAPKPRLINPGNQTTEAGVTVNLPISVAGGTQPFLWATPALPSGLTWNATSSSVSIRGIPTTATSTPFNVSLQVTDAFGYVSTAVFTWTITPGPAIAPIADRTGYTSTPDSLTATVGNGTSPYTWSATGLPPGISISGNGSTAKIAGTPTTAGAYSVVVKVTDAVGVSDTEPFTWTIGTGLKVAAVADRSDRTGASVSVNATLTGGSGPYNWSQTTNLPPGIAISGNGTTGKMSGTPTRAGTYKVTVMAVDSKGVSGATTFTWTVALGGNLNGGQTAGPVRSKYTCTWDVDVYGEAPFTWTASDTGVVITPSNNGSHAHFSVTVPYGTYHYTFQAIQTSTGGTLNGYSDCYAGTK